MRYLLRMLPLVGVVGWLSSAQGQAPGGDAPRASANSTIVTRMMAFNKKNDGKLTKDEVTDPRLHRLFDQADADKDGVVTKEELMTLAAKMEVDTAAGGSGPGGGMGGRGGPGGPGGDNGGPGGPGGRGPGGGGMGPGGGMGGAGGAGGPGAGGAGPGGGRGRPEPGQVLPGNLQDTLQLTPDQKKQLDELQKEVDARLAKILTDDQKKQLAELRTRGPGGPGGPGGGVGGNGGPGGGGPGGQGGPRQPR